MKTFSGALHEIEETLEHMGWAEGAHWSRLHSDLVELLDDHAEDIVKLWRAAALMRGGLERALTRSHMTSGYDREEVDINEPTQLLAGVKVYDKLLGGKHEDKIG